MISLMLDASDVLLSYIFLTASSHRDVLHVQLSLPWHGMTRKLSGMIPVGMESCAQMQPSTSLRAISKSAVLLKILAPIPTIPPAKQVRCCPSGSRSIVPRVLVRTVPEIRMFGSWGVRGLKKRCFFAVSIAFSYSFRY